MQIVNVKPGPQLKEIREFQASLCCITMEIYSSAIPVK